MERPADPEQPDKKIAEEAQRVPWRVQVAFQGGGAKLCALLAAAEAIQALKDRITVTRVAGTSAGAIVACLLATDRPITDVRAKLLHNGRRYMAMVVPDQGWLIKAFLLAAGKPLFRENSLRKVLGELFTFDGIQIATLGELTIPTIVTAADILNGNKVTFGKLETPNEKLVDALAHSCALPFVFRIAAPGANIVDGAFVANLPADELVADEESLGKVLAISFKRNPVPTMPEGSFGYAKALLDTAMNHSMERARARIGGGAVHEIETDITTFDFKGALNKGLDKHYEDVRSSCNKWFEDQLRLLAMALQSAPKSAPSKPEITSSSGITFIPPPGADADLRSVTKAIHEIYLREHHATPVSMERSALVVTLNSLHPPSDSRSEMADDVRQVLVFRPSSDKPIGCLRLGLVSSGTSAAEGLYVYRIQDGSGRQLEATVVPVTLAPGLEKDPLWLSRHLLFFFHPPLGSGSDVALPYTLTVLDQMYNTLPQIAAGSERVELLSDRLENVEVADIILYVPQSHAGLILADYRPDNGQSAISGRYMTNQELSTYDIPPPGFVAMGWRGRTLKPGERLGVRVLPPASRP